MSEELDFFIGLFTSRPIITLTVFIILVIVYLIATNRYRLLLNETSHAIHVAPISVKGKVTEWLGPDEAGLVLRKHLYAITETFERARSGYSSYYMDSVIGTILLGVYSASMNVESEIVPSEDKIPKDLVLNTPGFSFPIGAAMQAITKVIRIVPMYYRNPYLASVIYVSLVSHGDEAQVHVCMGPPSGVSPLKMQRKKLLKRQRKKLLKEQKKKPQKKKSQKKQKDKSLKKQKEEELPTLLSNPVRVETRRIRNYEDLKDLLREAASYVLELHPKAFPGRDGRSIRCLADGLFALDEYRRTGRDEKLKWAKERFSKTDATLVDDLPTLYFYGCLFLVDRTQESIDMAEKLFTQASDTLNKRIESKRTQIIQDLKQVQITDESKEALTNDALNRPLTNEDLKWVMKAESIKLAIRIKSPKRPLSTEKLKRSYTIEDLKQALKIEDTKSDLNLDDIINAITKEDLKLKSLSHVGLANCYAQGVHRLAKQKKEGLKDADKHIKIAQKDWEKTGLKTRHPWFLTTFALLKHVECEITEQNRSDMKKSFIESATMCLEAIEIGEENGTLLNQLGYVMMRFAQRWAEPLSKEDKVPMELIGNPAETAQKYFLKSLKINKNNKFTYSNLCLLYATPYYQGKDRKKYLERCRFYGEKAIQLDPHYINGHRDLALSLVWYKKFKEARKYYFKALELSDNVDKDQQIMQEAEEVLTNAKASDAELKRWRNPDPKLLSPPEPSRIYTSHI